MTYFTKKKELYKLIEEEDALSSVLECNRRLMSRMNDPQEDQIEHPENDTPIDFKRKETGIRRKYALYNQINETIKNLTQVVHHNLKVITFNVMGSLPTENIGEIFKEPEQPSIYVIGLQEIVSMNIYSITSSIITNNSDLLNKWENYLTTELKRNSNCSYQIIVCEQLVGIGLFVFVKKELIYAISNVEVKKVNLGAFKLIGNKGSLGVRLCFMNSHLCFINSHFAAGKSFVENRNRDFYFTFENMNFKKLTYFTQENDTLFNSDTVIWMGDLNYRLNIDESKMNLVFDYLNNNSLQYLLDNEQLNCAKKEGKVFNDFIEGSINFNPTYKYIPGMVSDYDQSPDENKRRMPAWCDRILFFSSKLKQLTYSDVPSVVISDHKPVTSTFQLELEDFKDEDFKDFVLNTKAKIQEYNSNLTPITQIETDPIYVDLYYGIEASRKIVVRNVGLSDVTINVSVKPINQPSQKREFGTNNVELLRRFSLTSSEVHAPEKFFKKWALIRKEAELYSSNVFEVKLGEEQSVQLDFLINFSNVLFLDCESGNPVLTAEIELDIIGDEKKIVKVFAKYLRSCFGCSLYYLASINQPVRFATQYDKTRLTSNGLCPEILKLVNAMKKKLPMPIDNLKYDERDKKSYLELRECLDTGEEIPENVESRLLILILRNFLKNLRQPLIEINFLVTANLNSRDEFMESIDQKLDEVRKINLLFVITFFQVACGFYNEEYANKLCSFFASSLCRVKENTMPYTHCSNLLIKIFLMK